MVLHFAAMSAYEMVNAKQKGSMEKGYTETNGLKQRL